MRLQAFAGAWREMLTGRAGACRSLGLIVLLAFATYSPGLSHGFVWDDQLLIVPVDAYWSADFAAILFSKVNALEYLPVRDMSLVLDAAIWGRSAPGFHLTNLLIYILTLPALYFIVLRLAGLTSHERGPELAFWATLLFAVHPLHAEPVNFIAARNNLLAMLFLALSLLAFLYAERRRMLLLSASLLAFVLALLCKASVVFYPLALVLICLLAPAVRAQPKSTVIFLAGVVLVDAIAIWAHLANAGATGMIAPDMDRFGVADSWHTLATALQIPWFYIGKALWPHPLSVLYPPPMPGASAARDTLIVALTVVLGGAIWWWWRRRAALALVGVGWLLASLGPVLNLVPTHPVVADRYVYLGSFGFALVLAAALTAATPRVPKLRHAAVALVLVWSVMSFERSLDWGSDVALFSAAYAAYPDEASSHYIGALMAADRVEEALGVDPRGGAAYSLNHARGLAAERRGDHAAALEYYELALRAGGEADQAVLVSAARAYQRTGDLMNAVEYYLRVVETPAPDPLGAHRHAAEQGIAQVREALSARTRALISRAAAHSDSFAEQFETGIFLHRLGLYESALEYYRRAASLQPDRWEIWYNVGLVQAKLGAVDEAIAAHRKVLAVQPQHLQTLNHLAINSAAKGDFDAAARYYRRALEANPSFAEAAFNLGRLYYRRGDRDEARRYFEMTLELAGADEALRARVNTALARLR